MENPLFLMENTTLQFNVHIVPCYLKFYWSCYGVVTRLEPSKSPNWVTPTVVGQTARSQYLPWSLPRPRIGPPILFGSRTQGLYDVWKLCCFRFPRIWVKLMNLRCLEISPDLSIKAESRSESRNVLEQIVHLLHREATDELIEKSKTTSQNQGWFMGQQKTRPPRRTMKANDWCDSHFRDLNHL